MRVYGYLLVPLLVSSPTIKESIKVGGQAISNDRASSRHQPNIVIAKSFLSVV